MIIDFNKILPNKKYSFSLITDNNDKADPKLLELINNKIINSKYMFLYIKLKDCDSNVLIFCLSDSKIELIIDFNIHHGIVIYKLDKSINIIKKLTKYKIFDVNRCCNSFNIKEILILNYNDLSFNSSYSSDEQKKIIKKMVNIKDGNSDSNYIFYYKYGVIIKSINILSHNNNTTKNTYLKINEESQINIAESLDIVIGKFNNFTIIYKNLNKIKINEMNYIEKSNGELIRLEILHSETIKNDNINDENNLFIYLSLKQIYNSFKDF